MRKNVLTEKPRCAIIDLPNLFYKEYAMDYVLLLCATLSFTLQFIFLNLYQSRVRQTLFSGLFFLMLAHLVGAVLLFLLNGCRLVLTPFSVIVAVCYTVIVVLQGLMSLKTLSYGNLAIYSMFMMLGGMMLPFFYGVIFLREEATPFRILGLCLMSACILLKSLGKKSEEKNGGGYLFLCFVVFFLSGMNSVVSKFHQTGGEAAADTASFLVLTALFTALSAGTVCLFAWLRGKKAGEGPSADGVFTGRTILLAVALGASIYGGTYLNLIAALTLPASVQYPIVSGGVIVLSAVAGKLVFRDTLTRREILAIAGTFLSTFLFAL